VKGADLELKSDVHLWVASCSRVERRYLAGEYRQMLTDEEIAQEKRFHFERDRRTYLVTRVLVRIVLSKYRPVDPESWRFARDEYGRPFIQDEATARELTFNISHSGGLVMLAIAEHGDLGVDVENTKRDPSVLELAERFFAQGELSQLRSLPDDEQDARFYALWTLKESYVKARGQGLAIQLDRFNFDLTRDGVIDLDVDPALGDSAAHWQFWQLELAPRHVAAICARRLPGVRRRLICRSIAPLVRESAFDPVILRTSSNLCS
jgi:4'-phosphopantetheinyl transferase